MSPTGLVNHLRQHVEEYQQYLEKKEEVKDAGPKQASINSFLVSTCTTKDLFKRKYTKWNIDQTMPFEVGSSESFHDKVNCLNKTFSVLDRKELLGILDVKKRQMVEFLKTMLTDTYFSITTDHWTLPMSFIMAKDESHQVPSCMGSCKQGSFNSSYLCPF